ncbi:glycoside hydrolase family 26 protein [Streptomyces griseoincarnatus]
MAPLQCRTGAGRLAVAAVVIALMTALVSGFGPTAVRSAPWTAEPAFAVVPPEPELSSPDSVPAAPEPRSSAVGAGTAPPAFGAFLGSDAAGVARIEAFSDWLGGAEVRVAHTYLPGDRWSNIEGAPGFLDSWANWRKAEADRMLVLNVPMLERNEENLTDAEVRALLRRGAEGEFDHHFRVLAERLVTLQVPDTVLVLGWEMNGTTYTHRCGPDPDAWKAYWDRIVTTMRSVPGQRFRFDFTPSRGRDAVPWTDCYPGDDTVDIIGMDAYDQPQGVSFDEQVNEPYGLRAHVDFARLHDKPVSYPEWGLFRNGDNADYMRRMLAWMDAHDPVYNTLSDYCPHGVWRCADHPEASLVYRTAHAADGKEPTVPTVPVPPLPTVLCPSMTWEDWIRQLTEGRLCLPLGWLQRMR